MFCDNSRIRPFAFHIYTYWAGQKILYEWTSLLKKKIATISIHSPNQSFCLGLVFDFFGNCISQCTLNPFCFMAHPLGDSLTKGSLLAYWNIHTFIFTWLYVCVCTLSKQICSLVHHASFCCTYEYNAIIFHTFILDVVSCVVFVVVVVAGYMALPDINL